MLAALLLAAATPALSAAEAQRLPLAELAGRVLGAAGALVVDVERPRWSNCVGLCPPQPPHPDGPPPLTTLTFFTRASASSAAGWMGLCSATAIDVSFDAGGTVIGLRQSRTTGWLGALTRQRGGTGPEASAAASRQNAEFEARCRALPTTRSFVAAKVPFDGEQAFIAVALVHDSLLRGGAIQVRCELPFDADTCGSGLGKPALAEDVAVEKIADIEQVDPRTGGFVTGGPVDRACYAISLAHSFRFADSINLCVHVSDSLAVTRAAFLRSAIVY